MTKVTISIEEQDDGVLNIQVRNEVNGEATPPPTDEKDLTDGQTLAALALVVIERATTAA
jgi:hypothetical protein